jgi:hypothetical protein
MLLPASDRIANAVSRTAPTLAPAFLAEALELFFTDNPRACVVEEGVILFDMAYARWTLDASAGRCVLQLWSEERNLVRTVIGLQARRDGLRLEVKRFGQTRPQILRLAPDREQRSPTVRDLTRKRYAALLARVLNRAFPELLQTDFTIAADLEHSFGPAYTRGMLYRGQSAWAIVGINAEESPGAVDSIVTIGILWMEQCRARAAGRRLVEGVKLVVPAGMANTVQERLPWLRAGIAKWQLYTLQEATETLSPLDEPDSGNLRVQLISAFAPELVLERSHAAVEQVFSLLDHAIPNAAQTPRERTEVLVRSPSEISFRLHGLEFARIRHGVREGSFAREDRISFGAGASETQLTDESQPLLCELVGRLFRSRHPAGSARDPLFRMQPERWLESVLRAHLVEIESTLQPAPIYTQVPALASADRGMLDLLAVTRDGRLAVLELKASEDLHMPLQGLDYWLRVRALHAAGEFARVGYFPGVILSPEPPLLYFIVPALRIHSTVDTILRHLAPEVEWRLLALDEKWRQKRSVIFRKQGGTGKRWPRVLAGQT